LYEASFIPNPQLRVTVITGGHAASSRFRVAKHLCQYGPQWEQ
jgi:hypothetical protein